MTFATLEEENKLWDKGYSLVCGVDEVGRGCFAGPVVTAAVMFPPKITLPIKVADSKLLSSKAREELVDKIKELALCFSITETPVELINKVGIGKATQISFYNSVKSLIKNPDFILIDAFSIGMAKKKAKINSHRGRTSVCRILHCTHLWTAFSPALF